MHIDMPNQLQHGNVQVNLQRCCLLRLSLRPQRRSLKVRSNAVCVFKRSFGNSQMDFVTWAAADSTEYGAERVVAILCSLLM